MPLVMLKRDWPGTFRRTIKRKDGSVVRRAEFTPGAPTEVTDEEFNLLEPDIDVALFEVRLDAKHRPRIIHTDADAAAVEVPESAAPVSDESAPASEVPALPEAETIVPELPTVAEASAPEAPAKKPPRKK